MTLVRLATVEDVPQLVQMRWDFSEGEQTNHAVTFEEFNQVCSEFLVKALNSGDWYIWVAERNEMLWKNGQKRMRSSFLFFGQVAKA